MLFRSVGGKADRVQQAADGQVQVPKPAEKKTTIVIDFVTETFAPKPSTKFITVTGYRRVSCYISWAPLLTHPQQ